MHALSNQALRDQYERAGFAGRVGWGRRPAVLVIDMARGWTSPDTPHGADLAPVLEAIVQLLAAARERAHPVFFTTMAFDPVEIERSVQARKIPHLRGLVPGSEAVTLVPELARRPDEALITKPRSSAFFATTLAAQLIAAGVDTTVVVGCSTSGCIRATSESAYDHGFRVIVPEQAVGDRSPSAHDAALFDIDARFGDVVDLEWTLQRLRNDRDA
jgi:nicotinamidase-related amidase